MSDTFANNKRIAKNTLLLYIRMLLTMLVSLYTSRVVLNALGVEDFGIYNVVGGVVSMFSILSGTLSAAISRFITFELGRGNQKRLEEVFSSSVTIQIGISLIIVLLVETIGVWFLNKHMNILDDRMMAANWVLQFSLLTFVVNLVSVPYNACIIAHEKMSAFAYISILEVVGRLAIAYFIVIAPIDRLVFYAILMCMVALAIRFVYGYYCKRHFTECTYCFIWSQQNHQLLKQMFGFAGWNFIGSASALLKDQGVNIVINLFCGATVNAARGIAMQINTAVNSFANNFITALNPQITKSYAEGNKEYVHELVIKGTRFSYYLLLCLSVPILANTNYILNLWLHVVPNYSVEFVQLILVLSLSDVLYRPLLTAHLATGRIKMLQIMVGGLNMFILPLCYLALYWGCAPTSTIWISIFFSIVGLFIRISLYRQIEEFNVGTFLRKVMLNVFIVTAITLTCVQIIQCYTMKCNTFLQFIVYSGIYFILTLFICIAVGLNMQEKRFVIKKIKNSLLKQ